IDKLTTGQWTPPPGTLHIVDDADHLDDPQLRRLTTHAGATNTKLLLVTSASGTPGPSRHLTAALAGTLPWTQQLGDTHSTDSALSRVATHLGSLPSTPRDDTYRQAKALLVRRDNLIGVYRNVAAAVVLRGASRGGPENNLDASL
nr:hypothetical protein [Mycobacterium sp.]